MYGGGENLVRDVIIAGREMRNGWSWTAMKLLFCAGKF